MFVPDVTISQPILTDWEIRGFNKIATGKKTPINVLFIIRRLVVFQCSFIESYHTLFSMYHKISDYIYIYIFKILLYWYDLFFRIISYIILISWMLCNGRSKMGMTKNRIQFWSVFSLRTIDGGNSQLLVEDIYPLPWCPLLGPNKKYT